ncbi:helix-turn-helix domain-containing protein [Fusibacter sp. 3D3]|uniref:helix-turn-helix domain-containing protein n=1 Tax=Fusibacter sp. 3D3 TaxID=1048380 RepID=UPI0008533FF4|nr:helix-turn-helix transcriptional regulator [Fusibacter sp. 3D3]GAU79993.1 DNA-binding protein [Fusibacter sp. 3D3]
MYSVERIIRYERKAQGISQEKLSDGICSASYLSRIETGDVRPSSEILEKLMERLGKQISKYTQFKSETELKVENLKYEARRFYTMGNYLMHERCIEQLQLLEDDEETLFNNQFLRLHQYLLGNKNECSSKKKLEELYDILKLTKTEVRLEHISNELLTQDEVILINNIAIQYKDLGEMDIAINLLIELRHYLEKPNIELEQKRRTYPVVMSNLSKWLSRISRYIECIEVCDKAIEYCIGCDSHTMLVDAYFNKGYALANYGMVEQGLKSMKLAYDISIALKQDEITQIIKQFLKTEYAYAVEI